MPGNRSLLSSKKYGFASHKGTSFQLSVNLPSGGSIFHLKNVLFPPNSTRYTFTPVAIVAGHTWLEKRAWERGEGKLVYFSNKWLSFWCWFHYNQLRQSETGHIHWCYKQILQALLCLWESESKHGEVTKEAAYNDESVYTERSSRTLPMKM